jgi:hypothetical protein
MHTRASPPRFFAVLFFALVLVAWLAWSWSARAAEPWFGFGDGRLEDRYADGDLDAEDLAARPGLSRRAAASGGGPQARTWVSLVSFYGEGPAVGERQWGVLGVVGLALDRVAEGPRYTGGARAAVPFAQDGAPSPSPSPVGPVGPVPTSARPVAALLARGAVRAAWRSAGIDADDERIDAMIARARASAALPEARFRALRLVDEDQKTTAPVDALGTYSDGTGTKLWLEGRLTWRLDRLLYADDEPTLERVRLERQEARARVAGRVLELLFAWARAAADVAGSPAGSRAELDAQLRWWEAEIALDVVTGGWFSRQPGVSLP